MKISRRILATAAATVVATGVLAGTSSPAHAVGACVDPLGHYFFGANAYGAGWADNSRLWASDSSYCKYVGDYYVWTASSGTVYQGKVYFNLPRPQ
jgi:hypothetical protein